MEEEVRNPTGGQVEEGAVYSNSSEENLSEDLRPVKDEVQRLQKVEKPIDKPVKNYKKIIKYILIVVCAAIILYFGMTIFFVNHFYFGSEINGMPVSGKSVEAVQSLMTAELQNFTLSLKERGRQSEEIKGSEVGLKYVADEEFQKLKGSQNPFYWISACFHTEDFKMTVEVTYDEKRLKERIDQLSCFDSRNIIEPQNPSFQYMDNNFVIINEISGNKVDKDILYSQVSDALVRRETEIDLESRGCYVNPQYTSKSQKTIEIKNTLNRYSASKISYTFGNNKEVVDGSIINKWLSVDKNFEIVVDEKKIEDYFEELSKKYNTSSRTRNFTTSSGKTIQISRGDFTRSIRKSVETQNVISAIKKGETITKDPSYCDIGDTYVEINLTDQHIWFYKNKTLIVEGDIVTGNISNNHATPKGVFRLKYKAKNVVLRGEDYAAPVTFWMPFNGGIGMHDANWRSKFGGEIYKSSGSHGCINCPGEVAKVIYNNIEEGTPVVCY